LIDPRQKKPFHVSFPVVEGNFSLLERAHEPVHEEEEEEAAEAAAGESDKDYLSPLRAGSPSSPAGGECEE